MYLLKAFLSIVLAICIVGIASLLGYRAYRANEQEKINESEYIPVGEKATEEDMQEIEEENLTELQKELKDTTVEKEIFEKLMYEVKKNPDTVAWLNIPDTNINNSVLQYHNNEYYQRRDERKKNNVYGCYYADYECSLSTEENLKKNTIIYGHSDLKDNPDGKRFSELFKFLDNDFAEKHKEIYLHTINESFTFEIFSVFYTDIDFDYIRVFMDDKEFQELIDKALSLSIRDYGIKPSAKNDKILTLSTCSVKYHDDGTGRFVVMGRLVTNDEL